MKLTQKDKEFIEELRKQLEEKYLRITLEDDGLKHLVLRQNYGDKIETAFGTSRQGVRWRFQRLFNKIYVSAYETILLIESSFGNELRASAMEIAKERVELRRIAQREVGALGQYQGRLKP